LTAERATDKPAKKGSGKTRAPVIGVTGGVGSGKSAFVGELARLGALTLDADNVANRLVNEDPVIREGLRKAFGENVFDGSGILKKKELAARVFSNPAELKILDGIVWPALVREIGRAVRRHRKGGGSVPLVVDMAVLFEAGCEGLFDAVVTVEAPVDKRVRWLSKSRGWDEADIRRRMAAQMDVAEKSAMADRTVRNTGDLRDLSHAAEELLADIHAQNPAAGAAGGIFQ
jgi:dephospho-CoA kinase